MEPGYFFKIVRLGRWGSKISLDNIVTARLVLVPVTLAITTSLLNGSKQELVKLGITTDEDWPRTDTMDILPRVHASLARDNTPSGFEFWMIVRKETMQVIGDIGFHGKPNDQGEVEIGYGLVERERGKGFGYEALQAVMTWLASQDSVKVIKADCLIDNKPSARILAKVGMKEIRRDSELIYWELIKPVSH